MPSAAPSPRRRRAADPDLALAERVCLALVAQGVSHGWALGTILAADGELGRVWALSRPLTYRAIDGLVAKRLITRREQATAGGRERAVLAATAAGRRIVATWLDEPVHHLRDVRTELLVKLLLRARDGRSSEALLHAQQAVFAPAIDALTAGREADVVDVWRREQARAIRRFLDDALTPAAPGAPGRTRMRLSARNQVTARVVSVRRGELMASVKAVLGDGQPLTATITQEAADDLDIAAGDAVVLVVKATEVMVAKA